MLFRLLRSKAVLLHDSRQPMLHSSEARTTHSSLSTRRTIRLQKLYWKTIEWSMSMLSQGLIYASSNSAIVQKAILLRYVCREMTGNNWSIQLIVSPLSSVLTTSLSLLVMMWTSLCWQQISNWMRRKQTVLVWAMHSLNSQWLPDTTAVASQLQQFGTEIMAFQWLWRVPKQTMRRLLISLMSPYL